MSNFLIPGSVIQESGIYRVSHSVGHRPTSECVIPAGLVLPSCIVTDCHVLYSFVRSAEHISKDEDFQDS